MTRNGIANSRPPNPLKGALTAEYRKISSRGAAKWQWCYHWYQWYYIV